MNEELKQVVEDLQDRLVRIESRLVQLFYFLGASPYNRYSPQGETYECHEEDHRVR